MSYQRSGEVHVRIRTPSLRSKNQSQMSQITKTKMKNVDNQHGSIHLPASLLSQLQQNQHRSLSNEMTTNSTSWNAAEEEIVLNGRNKNRELQTRRHDILRILESAIRIVDESLSEMKQDSMEKDGEGV